MSSKIRSKRSWCAFGEQAAITILFNIELLAEKLEGYSGADIEAVCEEATILAIRKGVIQIDIDPLNPKSYSQVKITP